MSGILSTLLVASGGPVQPKNLSASGYTATGYTLSWDNDTTITTYTVFYGPSKTQITGLTISLVGSTRSTVINTSAYTANTSYDFYVNATNSDGSIMSSAIAVYTNPASPDGLTAVNSTWAETQFKLTWTSVSGLTYTVWNNTTQLTTITTSPTGTISTINPTNTVITNLTPGTTYSFYVKATNSTTVAISSLVLSVTTPLAHAITVSAVNDTQTTLAWTNTAGYTFTLWNGVTQLTGWTTASGINTYINSGLTGNTLYTYYVKATNTFGISTSVVSQTTAPAAPSINYAVLTAANTMQVVISAASTGATTYTVIAKLYNGSASFNTYTIQSLSISGLTLTISAGLGSSSSYAAYLVSVKAVSSNGTSAEGTAAACVWLDGVANSAGTAVTYATTYTNYGTTPYNMTPTPVSNTFSLTGNWSTSSTGGAIALYGGINRIRIYNYATIWAGGGNGGSGGGSLASGSVGGAGKDAITVNGSSTVIEYFYNGGYIIGGGGGGGGGGSWHGGGGGGGGGGIWSSSTTYRGGAGGAGSVYRTTGNYVGSTAGIAGSVGGNNAGGAGGGGGTGQCISSTAGAASAGASGAGGFGSGGSGGVAGTQNSGGLPGGGGGGGGGPGGNGGAGGKTANIAGTVGGGGGAAGYAIRNFSKITTWANSGSVAGPLA
jgi:hypothetical protein